MHMKHALVTAQVELDVPFQDVDPMQIAWHGNYFRYFEAARVVLLREIDYDYPQMQATGFLWPIIEAHVRYVQALRYAQRIQIRAALVEWENRMKIDYRVLDAGDQRRLTTGYTIQCAIDARTNELQLASPAPLLERLGRFL